MSPRPSTARWIALCALIALAGGIALAARQWSAQRRAPLPGPPSGAAMPDTADESPVQRALAQAAGEDEKSGWVDEVHGVDVSELDAGRRATLVRFANAQRCTCGCGYTLAACRTYDPTCEVSLPRVEALLDSVRRGLAADVSGLRPRPEAKRAATSEDAAGRR